MSGRTERLFTWSGLGCLVLMGVGILLLARCVPPPSPAASAAEIAAFYRADPVRTRLGFQVGMIGSALIIPFVVALFIRMRRIEGGSSPWAYLQLATGVADMFVFILPMMVLQAALFRVDEIDPETLRTLNDLAWILFVSPASMIVLQMISVGAVALSDRSAHPAVPRSVGYYNLWAALVSACGVTVPFFTTGPLAWDGMFAYWIPVTAFVGFVLVNGAAMLRTPEPVRNPAEPTDHDLTPA
jgi:hypothetical protein